MELKKIILLILVMSCLTILLSIYLLNNSPDLKKPETTDYRPFKTGSAEIKKETQKTDELPTADEKKENPVLQEIKPVTSDPDTLKSESQIMTAGIKSPEKQEDKTLQEDRQAELVDLIINRFREDQNREKAFSDLVQIKDKLKRETLHTAMKEMYQFGDIGGNDILIETFLDPLNEISDHDRMRILSYINPEYTISESRLLSLVDVYKNNVYPGSSGFFLTTISLAGGDFGAKLIIDMINPQQKDEIYVQAINALGLSDSPAARDYLNQTLNELVRVEKDNQDLEMINLVRNLIQKKNPQ
jgi:hypothetical protein